MKRLIVYDLDGTLVDTLEDIAASANYMLRSLQAPPVVNADIKGYVGRGVRELVRACLKSDDEEHIARGVQVYRAYYAQHLLDHSRLYPGVREVLQHFSGRLQVVLTNKPDPFSTHLLRALGLARHFAQIIAGNGEFPRKPDPSAILALLKVHGVAPADALIIGDSPIDIQTGRGAGVMTVAVTQGLTDADALRQAEPDVLVADFPELLTIARQRGW